MSGDVDKLFARFVPQFTTSTLQLLQSRISSIDFIDLRNTARHVYGYSQYCSSRVGAQHNRSQITIVVMLLIPAEQ